MWKASSASEKGTEMAAKIGLILVFAMAAVLVQSQVQLLGCPGLPWCPQTVPCNYTEIQGPFCLNCTTRVICTPIGGIVVGCSGFRPNCNQGECSSAPSDSCAPTTTTSAP